MPVVIKLDLSKYVKGIAEELPMILAIDIVGKAQTKVRVGATGNLRASINFRKVDGTTWEVFSNVEYAAAQEWGLAPFGKPNYSFTPYMRPAAQEATSGANYNRNVAEAEATALRKAKV